MHRRWLQAALVCALALASHRMLTAKGRVRLRSNANSSWPRATFAHGTKPEQSAPSQDKFLAPKEWFAPMFDSYSIELTFSELKFEHELSVDSVHLDLGRTFLARLLLGFPERLPHLAAARSEVEHPGPRPCRLGPLNWCWARQTAEADLADEMRVTMFHAHLSDGPLVLLNLTLVMLPLNGEATREGLDRLLASQQMGRADLGAGRLEEAGFLLGAALTIVHPRRANQSVELACAGELFLAANTRGRAYEPGARGHFNLKQYGANVRVMPLLEQLDYYLRAGIENRGLLVGQPEFSCKLVGDNFLVSSLDSSLALVVKPSLPHVSWRHNFLNLRAIFAQLNTSVQQIPGPRHSAERQQYKTLIRAFYSSELAPFTRANYLKVLNTPASSASSSFQHTDSHEPQAGERDERHWEPFSELNRCPTAWMVDGLSTLQVDGLYRLNLALNFTQIWSQTVRQHRMLLIRTAPRHSQAPTGRGRKQFGAKEEEEEEEGLLVADADNTLLEVTLTDYKHANLTFLNLDFRRNWRSYVWQLVALYQWPASRLLSLLKLVRPARRPHQSEQALMGTHFAAFNSKFWLEERLVRCSAAMGLPDATRQQINCLPVGEDNDLYVRQVMVVSEHDEPNLKELACYPLKATIIDGRIQSSLRELHKANQLVSDQKLDGFVSDHLKLGFFCLAEWYNDAQSGHNRAVKRETTRLVVDTVIVVNKTTSRLRDDTDTDTDSDYRDTLIDQWNWLLEATFAGRLTEGLLLDSKLSIGLDHGTRTRAVIDLDQKLLLQEFFPFATYHFASSCNAAAGLFFTGTINQTCHDEPDRAHVYEVLDHKKGEQESERTYSLESYTKTSCSVYNTTSAFLGFCDDLNFTLKYLRIVQVNATDPRAATTEYTTWAHIAEDSLTMLGRGREYADKSYDYKCSWTESDQINRDGFYVDMRQWAKADDEMISTILVVNKELLHRLGTILEGILDEVTRKLGPRKSVHIYDLANLVKLRDQWLAAANSSL